VTADVNGNGHGNGSSNGGDEELQLVFEKLLDDAAVQEELRGIIAEAREQAQRNGVAVDRSQIIAALDRVTDGAGGLADPVREKLMSRFEQIVDEELGRVSEVHSS
jgi:hypothetical protein